MKVVWEWGKIYNNGICISTLYRTLAISLSLTKVNFHFKNDSATLVFSAFSYQILITRDEDKLTIKSINESIYTDITNRVNIITEED